jgi:hypothetical protein
MTSLPPPLVPSALISINRLNQFPDATEQPQLLFVPDTIKDTSPDEVLTHGFSTNTFVGEDSEAKVVHTHTNLQHITKKPSENLDFKNGIKQSQTTGEGTFERAIEHDKDLNLKNNSRTKVNEYESVESLTKRADDFRETKTLVITTVPDNEQSTQRDVLLNAGNSHLQPDSANVNSTHSVDNVMELLHGSHNYTVEEDYDAGIHPSTSTSGTESWTSEISPSHPRNTASDFDEGHIPVDEDAVTMRIKRSVSSEHTQRNSFDPHQNTSYDAVQPIVDWGGVSLNNFKYSDETFYLRTF